MRNAKKSKARFRADDLARLSDLARRDLEAFVSGDEPARAWLRERYLCRALCQGAAMHYVDGRTGVKDLDVYSFFAAGERSYPPRRTKSVDFGPSKFGVHPEEADRYDGRRVDLLGRSIEHRPGDDPAVSVVRYLERGLKHGRPKTTPYELACKAVVLIDPPGRRGEIIWYKGPIASRGSGARRK